MGAMAAGMAKEKVVKLLQLFPDIDEEIRTRRNIVSDLEMYYDGVQAVQYDGMPHGKNNISRPTEQIAMNIPDYVRKEIRQYEREITVLQRVKVEILKEVSRLHLRHKKIVFGFYFNGMKWEEVAERTNYSDRQCKNIRDEALEKLSAWFGENEALSMYEIKE